MGLSSAVAALGCILFIFMSSASGLKCHQCNVNLCNRNTTQTPQCKLLRQFHAAENETVREKLWGELSQLGGRCDEAPVDNCLACTKVLTNTRRILPRGVYLTDTVLSKVCATKEPYTKEDKCYNEGPRHARQYVCHCFTDLCNAAESIPHVGIVHKLILIISLIAVYS